MGDEEDAAEIHQLVQKINDAKEDVEAITELLDE